MVEIQNLCFDYGWGEEEKKDKYALDNVSLNIDKGSFVAILGQNGSGKSTLAKNINALFIPSSGTVYVKGMDTKDESKTWDIRQTAGMVFQNPDNQIVSAVVEEDVAFGPENLGIEPKVIRERVDGALKAVKMYEFRKSAPHKLSGGQKQRVAIAGVVAMKPECIIFDEPTAMLDPEGRQEVMNIIKELNGEGITVILITHFMEEAAEADRIVLMAGGKVVKDGSPQEIFNDVESLYSLGMKLPVAVELAEKLRNLGIDVPKDIINIDDMVIYLSKKNAVG